MDYLTELLQAIEIWLIVGVCWLVIIAALNAVIIIESKNEQCNGQIIENQKVMYLNTTLKEKLFERGYNVICCRFIGGRSTICVVSYLCPKEGLFCKIVSTDDLDIFNALLLACNYGSKLNAEVMKAFFPELEKTIEEMKKKYPAHFQNQ